MDMQITRRSLFPLFILAFICTGICSDVWASAKKNPFKFVHLAPSAVAPNRALQIKGKATENDELDAVQIFYRTTGKKKYSMRELRLSSGIFYTVTLPGTQIQKPALEYYIIGIDADKKIHPLYGSARQPHRVSVRSLPRRKSAPSTTLKLNDSTSDASDEELIYSASRREQRIQNAPSVVTVITASDIKSNGWRTVLEILRYVVGVHIDDNGHWANFGIRGVNPRLGYGEKMIILLDGHNMSWRQFNRNYLNPSWVTVDNIKRIEIIRGPGSSLWGANAISGVINIITKTAHDLKGFQAVGGGSPLSQTFFMTLQGGQDLGHGLIFRASASVHRQNRSPVLAPIKEFLALKASDYERLNKKNPGTTYKPYRHIEQGDEYFAQQLYMRLSWKGVSASFHQSRYDPHAPLSTFSQLGGSDSRFVTDRYISMLSWALPLSTWGTLLTYASFDYYTFARGTAYESNPFAVDRKQRALIKMSARDARFELGTQFSAQLHTSDVWGLSLSTGLDYEFLDLIRWHFPEVWEQNKLKTPQFQNHHFSAFLQVQASLFRKIHLTLGGRFDYDEVYGAVFTPRAALVFTPGRGFYTKLLYGNAFKAPSYHDLYYFRKNAFYGNRTLKPESVQTFEVQVGWQKSRLLSISVNGYLSLFRDLIGYRPRQKTDPIIEREGFPSTQLPDGSKDYKQKGNISNLTTFGGELEMRMYLVKGLSVLGSFGLFFGHQGTLDSVKGPLYYSPQWQGNLAASYRFKAGPVGLSFALGAQLTGPKAVPAKSFNPVNSRFPTGLNGERIGVPSWTNSQTEANQRGVPFDPTLESPLSVRTYLTVQVTDIVKHFDVALRLTNLLNRDNYDANDLLLYPQEKFNMMIWVKTKY